MKMKNGWLWVIAITIIVMMGLLFLLGVGLLSVRGMPMHWISDGSSVWRGGFWHHHGFRGGIPMMGLFGGLLMLIFPVGLLVLIIGGIVLLVRALQQPNTDRVDEAARHCGHCGKRVAPDWQVCPYCGEPLSS
jgi:hypothetical protein